MKPTTPHLVLKTYPRPTNCRGPMQRLVRDIAGLKLDQALLLADLDRQIQHLRDNFDTRLKPLQAALEEKTATARQWAETHPDEFGHRRSINFSHGVAGYRLGTPRLKTVRTCRWDQVLQSLRDTRWGAPYIRVKEELNKEQIIADVTAGKLNEAALRKAGAQVVQEDSFFVDPKLTKSAAKRT